MNATQTPIRILSVDDHPLLREGVASLLAGQADLKLVAEASNGREAVEQFRVHRPDITLMDLQMPEMNGVEAMIAISTSAAPRARMPRGVSGWALVAISSPKARATYHRERRASAI